MIVILCKQSQKQTNKQTKQNKTKQIKKQKQKQNKNKTKQKTIINLHTFCFLQSTNTSVNAQWEYLQYHILID